MWCNSEVATPPQPLHSRGQHGGGRPLRKRLTLIYCILISCLYLPTALVTGPNYFCLLKCFGVGSGSSVDHASGGVGGVLASGGVGGVLASGGVGGVLASGGVGGVLASGGGWRCAG